MDYSIRISGEAGQGVQTVAETLARVFARSGYQVFTHQDYESRIRGGHNYFQVRISDHPLSASRQRLNLVIALDATSLEQDLSELQEDGLVLYDSQTLKRREEGTRHTFNGLHGRALPVATGIRLANHTMPVFVTTGDGDCYGEGGNHLIHAMRRNVKVTLIVHDNQIYGLTKGQASPTTAMGMVTKNQPFGSQSEPLSPLAMAVALDCSFVARGFSGEPDHLTSLIVEAARWPGFALIDVLQPCVSFNPVNTLEWYAQRVYHLEEGYDPEDRLAAFSRSLEWEKRIPLGILYRHSRLTLEEQAPSLRGEPLTRQTYDRVRLEGSLAELA